MRILHTGDWHVGKLLCGRPRLDEQAAVFDEIAAIADAERADIVLAAGDIFDTATPSAAAETLFYRAALKMAANGRHFIALAGNHDDPDRLRAPESLAAACNITLYGGGSCVTSATGTEAGEGWLRVQTGGETLNLAMVPFPSYARAGAPQDLPYTALFKEACAPACGCFTTGGINILMSHIFMLGAEQSGEERELGSARLLPLSALPDSACYTALGHIHKPMTVSKSRNIYYSGSVLSYSFDDVQQKRVLLVDTDGKTTTVKSIPLKSGKRLIRVTAADEDEAMRLVEEHMDKHVSLLYRSDTPLAPGRVRALKAGGNLVEIIVEHTGVKDAAAVRTGKTDSELFALYHEKRTGKPPDGELAALFLDLMDKSRKEE